MVGGGDLFKVPDSAESYLSNGRAYAVTPDGQRFLAIVSAADSAPRPATVILDGSAGFGGPGGRPVIGQDGKSKGRGWYPACP